MNRVPKFVEQKMARKRRERKLENNKSPAPVTDTERRMTSFDIARKKYEEKQANREKWKQEQEDKQKKIEEKKKERKNVGKLIRKRNDRGQPNMHSRLDLLMQQYKKKSSD
jgi:hypothetical protein